MQNSIELRPEENPTPPPLPIDKSMNHEFSYGNYNRLKPDGSETGTFDLVSGLVQGIIFCVLVLLSTLKTPLIIPLAMAIILWIVVLLLLKKQTIAFGITLGLLSPLLLLGACSALLSTI